jgi:hypothetical protein
VQVEDTYVVSDNNVKWKQITDNFAAAQSSSPETLFLTNTSGYKSLIFGIPSIPDVSNAINPLVTSYFSTHTNGRFGIVAMDFVDAGKSLEVLRTNFDSSGAIPSGTYKIVNANSGKAIDVDSLSTQDGAKIEQWSYHGGNNQRWVFTDQGGGYYQIAALHSGKALDNPGFSSTAGTAMDQWSTNGGGNQIWQVLANDDGTYRLVNKASGLALDVAGGATTDGTNIIQWGWTGSSNQKWLIQAP